MQNDRSTPEQLAYLRERAREVRKHIIAMIHASQSGHPGGALSCADILTALYFHAMNIDPKDPHKADRDRFILSKGHACPAWYACLALRGYFPIEELATLRKFGSILQGHPDMKKTPGVDMTTGSLGQGASAAIGMALEGKMVGAGYRVFAVLGDGELDEGIVWEAAMCAGKYKLDNLVFIVDYNRLQLDGTTDEVMPLEPLEDKFRSFGWKAMTVNGHDMPQLVACLESVRKPGEKPTCVIASTVKGKGVSFMENKCDWHGKAPNDEEYRAAIKEIEESKR